MIIVSISLETGTLIVFSNLGAITCQMLRTSEATTQNELRIESHKLSEDLGRNDE